MKIALCDYVSSFSKAYQYGGVQVKLFEKARFLMERGHQVTIYASPLTFGRRLAQPAEHMAGIPYVEGWRNRIRADVAYIVYYSPLAWRILFQTTCPLIAGLHAPGLLANTSPRHHLFRTIGSQDLAAFRAVRIVNPIFRFHHKHVYHIPDWVDINHFQPLEKDSARFTALFVGRTHAGKGYDTFLEMAALLKDRGYDFSFVATGPGNGIVKGLGHVPREKMPEIYAQSHVLVSPAVADTFGIVIIEALASGTPVVTTPILAHRKLELPLRYALSPQEYADQVVTVYQQWREDRSAYEAERARLRASVEKFDAGVVLPQLEDMLREVAGMG